MILHADQNWPGSDFNFLTYTVDVSAFVTNRFNHTPGFNLYGSFSRGDMPFQSLTLLGGPNMMRGYIEGRFRNRHCWPLKSSIISRMQLKQEKIAKTRSDTGLKDGFFRYF